MQTSDVLLRELDDDGVAILTLMARDAEAGIGAFTRKDPMPEWTGE